MRAPIRLASEAATGWKAASGPLSCRNRRRNNRVRRRGRGRLPNDRKSGSGMSRRRGRRGAAFGAPSVGTGQSGVLVRYGPDADGEWREVTPHQCKDDCYTASLRIEGRQLLAPGPSTDHGSGSRFDTFTRDPSTRRRRSSAKMIRPDDANRSSGSTANWVAAPTRPRPPFG